MPKVILTAQVQDPVKWEAGFRTHGDLFRGSMFLRSPVHYTITGNEVAICAGAREREVVYSSHGVAGDGRSHDL